MTLNGLHHVTVMAGDPQKNIDFYVGVLGLRMVKKTVNFADPETNSPPQGPKLRSTFKQPATILSATTSSKAATG